MNFSVKCGSCGCEYNPKPLMAKTNDSLEDGEAIYKVVGEDTSCPQCGFGKGKDNETFVEGGSTGKQLLFG